MDSKTTAKVKDEKNIEVCNTSSQVLSLDEFKNFFEYRLRQLDQLKVQVKQQTEELTKINENLKEEDMEKIKEFAAIMEKAEQYNKIKTLQETIQKAKIQVDICEKDLLALNETRITLK